MGKKRYAQTQNETHYKAPATLEEHPFYDLQLDEDQKRFRDAIWDENIDIVFCNSKAGTGKTLVAVGTANLLVKYGKFKQLIYVTSPCNEHRLGFMPGTSAEKSAFYYEPLYSALNSLGINAYTAIQPDNIAEQKYSDGYIKPMTDVFLRGCNLEDAIVVIEEMQNHTVEICKKILTRVCKNTKVVCIGHTGQNDLKVKSDSGFARYIQHFANKNDSRVAVCELTKSHRSWVAQWADELE